MFRTINNIIQWFLASGGHLSMGIPELGISSLLSIWLNIHSQNAMSKNGISNAIRLAII
jgi:hypothetical protein